MHFVIANSPEEARERGKHVEKSIRNHSRRLNDSLNDSQLMAAFAITRGNITCRDGDEYMDLSLGDWNDDDDKSVTAALASALNLSEDTADRVCWAFPACSDKESDMVKRGTDDTDDRCVLIDDYYKEYDASLTGIKASLDSRHRKMDNLRLHINSGCMGYHPDCSICKSLKRNLKRRYARTEPHQDSRVGHTWGFDLLTSKEASLLGNKYCMVMRDFKTGYFKIKNLRTKDQVPNAIRESIQELRSDPRFQLPVVPESMPT